jgi:hypothetical protein
MYAALKFGYSKSFHASSRRHIILELDYRIPLGTSLPLGVRVIYHDSLALANASPHAQRHGLGAVGSLGKGLMHPPPRMHNLWTEGPSKKPFNKIFSQHSTEIQDTTDYFA